MKSEIYGEYGFEFVNESPWELEQGCKPVWYVRILFRLLTCLYSTGLIGSVRYIKHTIFLDELEEFGILHTFRKGNKT